VQEIKEFVGKKTKGKRELNTSSPIWIFDCKIPLFCRKLPRVPAHVWHRDQARQPLERDFLHRHVQQLAGRQRSGAKLGFFQQ